jgi:hypothetical protein
MVVHTPTARMLTLLGIRKLADVSPVIIGKKYDHIVRHPESLFIQDLYLLI